MLLVHQYFLFEFVLLNTFFARCDLNELRVFSWLVLVPPRASVEVLAVGRGRSLLVRVSHFGLAVVAVETLAGVPLRAVTMRNLHCSSVQGSRAATDTAHTPP